MAYNNQNLGMQADDEWEEIASPATPTQPKAIASSSDEWEDLPQAPSSQDNTPKPSTLTPKPKRNPQQEALVAARGETSKKTIYDMGDQLQSLQTQMEDYKSRIENINIKVQARTATPEEIAEGKQLVDAHNDLFDQGKNIASTMNTWVKAENKQYSYDPMQGKLERIKLPGGSTDETTLRRSSSGAYYDAKRGGWWFDKNTPAPDVDIQERYGAPVVSKDNVDRQMGLATGTSLTPTANKSRWQLAQEAAGLVAYRPEEGIKQKTSKIDQWLNDPANKTSWVVRDGKKQLIRVGDGSTRMGADAPQGEGWYKLVNNKLIKTEEVMNPEYSRQSVTAKDKARADEAWKIYGGKSWTAFINLTRAALAPVKGAASLVGAKPLEEVVKKKMEAYEDAAALVSEEIGEAHGKGWKKADEVLGNTGLSIMENIPLLAASGPIGAVAEGATASWFAAKTATTPFLNTMVGKAVAKVGEKAASAAARAAIESVQMKRQNESDLFDSLVHDGIPPSEAARIAGKTSNRLSAQNFLMQTLLEMSPWSMGARATKAFKLGAQGAASNYLKVLSKQSAEELKQLSTKATYWNTVGQTLKTGGIEDFEEWWQGALEHPFDINDKAMPYDVDVKFSNAFTADNQSFLDSTGNSLQFMFTKPGAAKAIEALPATMLMAFGGAIGGGRSLTKSGRAKLTAHGEEYKKLVTPQFIPSTKADDMTTPLVDPAVKQKQAEEVTQALIQMNADLDALEQQEMASKAVQSEQVTQDITPEVEATISYSPLNKHRSEAIGNLSQEIASTGDISDIQARVAVALNPTIMVGKSGLEVISKASDVHNVLMIAQEAGIDNALLNNSAMEFKAMIAPVEAATAVFIEKQKAVETADVSAIGTKEHRKAIAEAEQAKHKVRVISMETSKKLDGLVRSWVEKFKPAAEQAKAETLQIIPDPVLPDESITTEEYAGGVQAAGGVSIQAEMPSVDPRFNQETGIFEKSGLTGTLPANEVGDLVNSRLKAMDQEIDSIVDENDERRYSLEATRVIEELKYTLKDLTEREYADYLTPESRAPYGTSSNQLLRQDITDGLNRLRELTGRESTQPKGEISEAEPEPVQSQPEGRSEVDGAKNRQALEIGKFGRVVLVDAKEEFTNWFKGREGWNKGLELAKGEDEEGGEEGQLGYAGYFKNGASKLRYRCSMVELEDGTQAFVTRIGGNVIHMMMSGGSLGDDSYYAHVFTMGGAATVSFILSESRASGAAQGAYSSGKGAYAYSAMAKIVKGMDDSITVIDGNIVSPTSFIARSRFTGSKFDYDGSRLVTPIENIIDMKMLAKFDNITKKTLARVFEHCYDMEGGVLSGTAKRYRDLYNKIMQGASIQKGKPKFAEALKAKITTDKDNAFWKVISEMTPEETKGIFRKQRERFKSAFTPKAVFPSKTTDVPDVAKQEKTKRVAKEVIKGDKQKTRTMSLASAKKNFDKISSENPSQFAKPLEVKRIQAAYNRISAQAAALMGSIDNRYKGSRIDYGYAKQVERLAKSINDRMDRLFETSLRFSLGQRSVTLGSLTGEVRDVFRNITDLNMVINTAFSMESDKTGSDEANQIIKEISSLARDTAGIPNVTKQEKTKMVAKEATKSVIEQLNKQLLDTNLYSEDEAEATSEVCGRIVENIAKEIGMDPVKFFNKYGVRVEVDGNVEEGSLHQSAYHGAGADFDKFSLKFVGAGEGGKMFGWGIYTTESMDIAEYYRGVAVVNAQRNDIPLNGIKIGRVRNTDQTVHKIVKEAISSITFRKRMAVGPVKSKAIKEEATVKEVVDDINELIRLLPEDSLLWAKSEREAKARIRLEELNKVLEFVSKFGNSSLITESNNKGQTFKVEVPDVDKMLDLNKTLSSQPEYVKERIKDIVDKYSLDASNSGWDLYQALVHNEKPTTNGLKAGDNQGRSERNYMVASLILSELGVEGNVFMAQGGTGGKTGDIRNFVVFNDEAVEITKKFYQDERGSIKIGKDSVKINLLKNMDKTTFFHEFMHLSLEMIGDAVKSPTASEQLKKDYSVLLRFLGVKNRSEIGVEQHEKMARAFEKYLMEGKAPIGELDSTFKKIANWFKSVYKQLTALGVNLNPQVTDVFDRLISGKEKAAMPYHQKVAVITRTAREGKLFQGAPLEPMKITVGDKQYEVTEPHKVQSLQHAKSLADAINANIRQQNDLSKDDKHEAHKRIGTAHKDYKQAVVDNQRINEVPPSVSDALGIKGLEWFYTESGKYVETIKSLKLDTSEKLQEFLVKAGVPEADANAATRYFESYRAFPVKDATEPTKVINVEAETKTETIAEVESPLNVFVEAKPLQEFIKEMNAKVKPNKRAVGAVTNLFAGRAFFALTSERFSRLSSAISKFTARIVSVKNEFAVPYEAMRNACKDQIQNRILGFMLGWTTVNSRLLTEEEIKKMFPAVKRETIEAYTTGLAAMNRAREIILKAAVDMNDQILLRHDDVKVRKENELKALETELQAIDKGDEVAAAEKSRVISNRKAEIKNIDNEMQQVRDNYEGFSKKLMADPYYWPLSRFGKYKITYKHKTTGEVLAVFLVDKIDDKEELNKQIELQSMANPVLKKAIEEKNTVAGRHIELRDVTDAFTGESPFNVDGALLAYYDAAAKLTPETSEQLELAVMSGKSSDVFKSHLMSRRGVPGWSTDAFKTFDSYIHSLSSTVANMEHALKMDDELKTFTQNYAIEHDINYDARLHEQARGQVDHAKHPPSHQLVNKVLAFGFIKDISARPAFAIAQMTQLAASVLPALGTFYGYKRAAIALRYGLKIALRNVGWSQLDKFALINKENATQWVKEHVKADNFMGASNDPKVRERIAEMTKEMILRAADSGSLQAAPSFGLPETIIGDKFEKIAEGLGVIALKSEQINRIATLTAWAVLNVTEGEAKFNDNNGFTKSSQKEFLAKFDNKNTKEGITEAVYRRAETINELSNYIRGRGNQPKYLRFKGFQGSVARLMFNYKNFSIGYMLEFHALGIISARKAGEGKLKKTLAYAKPQLIGMGIQALMGGPKAYVYFKLLETLLKVFPWGEKWLIELYDEIAKRFKKALKPAAKKLVLGDEEADRLTEKVYYAVCNGLPTLTGVDMSSMLEGDLMTMGNTPNETLGTMVLGANGGALAKALVEWQKYGFSAQGFGKAMKTLMPSFLRGPIEAYKGEASVGGVAVPLTTGERALRVAGLQPTRIAAQREKLNTEFEVKAWWKENTKRFATKYKDAYHGKKTPDAEEAKAVRDEFKAFVNEHKDLMKKYRIKPSSREILAATASMIKRKHGIDIDMKAALGEDE